ncbi:MAG: dihydroneopterin aldolase [SAR116 cluster bacterium MED-G04]|jgi:dihydroneopterin aldolase|nr:dihydroneopterin aldolase [SAR116 cluster bacterium]OUW37596.1 MAG: dihydroneopterin aldolase [Gammaproteobacteria bacterium TMED183]PDH63417.1 MAG: dihydroneopterin aldolase [SAR116 cluster bacterium MED-G04]HCD49560.1 dihydroneopterin aldolase [Alphaproteobacteria bacterium]CAI8378083.1 MAG: Dihydroneopterin aldolase [SAR116 cluster bacterium MED-G04]|tara:strand:- start:2316 stop:2687 length:372 start_codon:yes stop_codon:yes gene_type:complete
MTLPITRTVSVLEIEVICSIGLHDFERAEKQRVLIDVELRLDADAEPTRDTVDETLDYDDVRNAVIAVASDGHYDLQETLARRIFDTVMALKDVTAASVRTQKPDVYPSCRTVAYRLSNFPGE